MSESRKSKICPLNYGDAVVSCLEAGFKILEASNSTSLLKRFLTREIFEKLKMKKTSYGATLLDCIQFGIENLDLVIGIYAADPECYEVFADLFIPIIAECQRIAKTTMHPGNNWGMVADFADMDPKGKYIVSTGVKCCRNLKGYPFNALMTEANYKEIETKLRGSLRELSGELQGTYHSLTGLPQSVQKTFIADHYFREGHRYLQAVDGGQFWPSGRGVYFNRKKNFVLWIGEEAHVTIMSMQPGGNVGEVFKRLIKGLDHLQKRMEFSTDGRFGYLTSCPSYLGHALRAYFQIKVPKLAEDMPKLQQLAAKYDMQVTKVASLSNNFEGLHELSNAKSLGCTEYHFLKKMYLGIRKIIEAEKGAPELNLLNNHTYIDFY